MAPEVQQAIHALMNAGAGRARYQLRMEHQKQLGDAIQKLNAEVTQAIDEAPFNEGQGQLKAETIQVVALAFGKLQAVVVQWRNEAERAAQLEQPALEEAGQRAMLTLASRRPSRLARALKAALSELKAP